MHDEVLFKEEQRFNQWYITAMLILINMGTLGSFIYYLYSHSKTTEDWKTVFGATCFGAVISIIVTIIFLKMKLQTEIRRDGVYARFFPFHRKFHFYPWETLKKLYIREYKAIMEYGGYGLRIGFYSKGIAYNIAGDKGLQMSTTDGKNILIGTQSPEEMHEVLRKLGQLKE